MSAGIAVLQAASVRFYEERGLRERYGTEYDAYRRAVPRLVDAATPVAGAETPSGG